MAGINAFSFNINLSTGGSVEAAIREHDQLWLAYLQDRAAQFDTPPHPSVEVIRDALKTIVRATGAAGPWGQEYPQASGNISVMASLTPITEEPPPFDERFKP